MPLDGSVGSTVVETDLSGGGGPKVGNEGGQQLRPPVSKIRGQFRVIDNSGRNSDKDNVP